MLTTTELYRSSIMANLDYKAILGKRLRLTLDFPNAEDAIVTGVCVGYVVIDQNFSHKFKSEILFLEDGFDEADFVSCDFDRLEVID